MKTKIIAAIISGVIIFTGVGYLYDQMYDCFFTPAWIKLPRSYGLGDCLQMYADGTLPDWTKERENHAKKQAHNSELIQLFQDMPEVISFYAKYEDANVSVRDDHVSYFAGHEDDLLIRMNMFFDETNEIDHMDFHCYFEKEHLTEIAQEDIVYFLENRDCKPTEVSSITNFEECIAAGNPAMESYPRQCRTQDGLHFVEEISIPKVKNFLKN